MVKSSQARTAKSLPGRGGCDSEPVEKNRLFPLQLSTQPAPTAIASRARLHFPPSSSQILSIPLAPPAASVWPSGEKATHVTAVTVGVVSAGGRVSIAWPVFASHSVTWACLSRPTPAVASKAPNGANATP